MASQRCQKILTAVETPGATVFEVCSGTAELALPLFCPDPRLIRVQLSEGDSFQQRRSACHGIVRKLVDQLVELGLGHENQGTP